MQDLIEIELSRSRAIIASGNEVVPRFRISTADGETLIFVQLPDDLDERARRMQLVASYMAVHMARSFIMASELMEPDALSSVAVTRQGCEAGLQIITRNPLEFSDTMWIDQGEISDELTAMLPGKVEAVTREQIAEVEHLIRTNEGLKLESL